jgi:hypothetical protein
MVYAELNGALWGFKPRGPVEGLTTEGANVGGMS